MSGTGETTKTGAPVEQFGEGREAQSAAGHKGADISNSRSTEAKQEAGRKAARTRAERYGEELGVSAEENDDLKGTKTTV
ncbi:g584 [Coccomyxa viridis]|uniref:G584 protein n=1 Tax=Coccomyxa viridis TaxID=1274662 RepID=A0ABP1FG22_9CHLO